MSLDPVFLAFGASPALPIFLAVVLGGVGAALVFSRYRLRDAEKFIRQLSETVPSIIAVYDLEEQRIVRCSRMSEKVCGYTEAELGAMSETEFFGLVHEEDRQHVLEIRRRFAEGETDEASGFVYRIRHKNGREIWFEGAFRAFKKGRDGKCRQLIFVNVDVTAKRESERERERMHRLLDSSAEGFCCMDLESRMIYVNNRAADFGWSTDTGHVEALLADEESANRFRGEGMTRAASGESWTGRLQLKNLKTGQPFPSLVRLIPLRPDGKTPEGMALVATDESSAVLAETEIAMHKSRAELAVRGGRMGVFDWDMIRGECVWDEEMGTLYGREPRRPIRLEEWFSLLVPEGSEDFQKELQEAIEGEKPLDTTFRIVKGDGSVAWIRTMGQVIRDVEGKPIRMTGLNWDVTQDVLLKEELAKSKAYFEAILDTVANPIFVRDSNYRMIYCNRAYTELLGKSRDELIGGFESDIWPQEVLEANRKASERAFAEGEVEQEITITNARNERRNLLVKRMGLKPEHGSSLVVGSVSDITMMKTLQQIALQNEKQLRTFIEQFPHAVAMFDADMKCLAASHAWLTHHRLEWSPFIGQEFHRAMPLMPEKWNRAHHRALGGQVVRCFEDRAVGPEGDVQWLNWEVRPWHQAGAVGGFLIMVESVTEKKTAFEEIERTRARQVESSRLLSIGQMAAGVAHEINNPLTVIMGKAWMIQEKAARGADIPPESLMDAMKKIGHYSERIGKIVKALRDFSRDSSSDPMTQSSLADILNDTFSMCGERFRHNNVELIVESVPEDLELKCRPSQITQILVNLLNNAYDAARNGPSPWVKLNVKAVGNSVQIRVHDSGEGVAPGLEGRIFEPFFTTKEIGKGTGLGLSISMGIVRDHGGTLSLDQTISRSCFLLILPLNAASARGVA